MSQKTVLLVDDEQGFIEPLVDALESEGYRVLKAATVEAALQVLSKEDIHVITIDVMLPPGPSLEAAITSRRAGVYLCERVRQEYPNVQAFCISVLSEREVIEGIEKLGVRFLKKGEIPLRTVLAIIGESLARVSTPVHPKKTDWRGRSM